MLTVTNHSNKQINGIQIYTTTVRDGAWHGSEGHALLFSSTSYNSKQIVRTWHTSQTERNETQTDQGQEQNESQTDQRQNCNKAAGVTKSWAHNHSSCSDHISIMSDVFVALLCSQVYKAPV